MFKKSKMLILIFLIFNNILYCSDKKQYTVEDKNILYKGTNKVINSSLSDTGTLVLFDIDNMKNIGEVIYYQVLSVYKQQCYSPIIDDKINYAFCIEIGTDFSKEPPVSWFGTLINIEPTPISKIDLSKLFNLEKSDKKSIGVVKNNKMVFENLPIYNSNNNKICDNHTIDISFWDENFPYIYLDYLNYDDCNN